MESSSDHNANPWPGRIRIAVSLILAIIFLWSGLIKAIHPDDFGRVLYRILAQVPSSETAVLLGLLIGVAETALGVILLLDPRSSKWIKLAIALLILYIAVLIRLLLMDDPPSCSCLSVPGLHGTTWEVIAGMARNAALIWLGVLTLRLPANIPSMPREHSATPHRCSSGFTLIELLVVISTVVILTGLLLPAIAGAHRQSKLTRLVANQRQLNFSLAQYCDDNDASLPYFAVRNHPYSEIRIGTETFDDGFSYFSAQVHFWATPLVPNYISDPSMIEDQDLHDWMAQQGHPGIILARSAMTATVFAAPDYFTDAARQAPIDYGHFRSTRLWEVVFPSDKALLTTFGAIGAINDSQITSSQGHPCSFADGSTAAYQTNIIDTWPAVLVPWFGITPVLTTERGLAGRDR